MQTSPHFEFIKVIVEKPLLLMPTVPIIVATPLVVDFIGLCHVLFWMFIIDLITGIFASYFDWKKTNSTDKWFFGKGEGFSSKKAKSSAVKALVYVGLPYLLIQFQKMLLIKNFKYERFSDAEFEMASVAVILFCLIEGFSIFHENLPKCGFNIWTSVKKIIGFYKKVKTELKD